MSRDPNYALAYAGLAEAYALLPTLHVRGTTRGLPESERLPRLKALQLDDTLAEAHTALAYVLSLDDVDIAGSISEFQRAIALNSNYATAHHWYGRMDRLRQSAGSMKRSPRANAAVELDPLSPIINTDLGQTLTPTRVVTMRRSRSCARRLEIDPAFLLRALRSWYGASAQGQLPAAID